MQATGGPCWMQTLCSHQGIPTQGKTLQQNKLNEIPYVSKMEIHAMEKKEKMHLFFFFLNSFSGGALIRFSAQKLWRWRGLLDYFFLTSLCSFHHCFYPPVEITFLMDSITYRLVLMSPVTVVGNDTKSNDL